MLDKVANFTNNMRGWDFLTNIDRTDKNDRESIMVEWKKANWDTQLIKMDK